MLPICEHGNQTYRDTAGQQVCVCSVGPLEVLEHAKCEILSECESAPAVAPSKEKDKRAGASVRPPGPARQTPPVAASRARRSSAAASLRASRPAAAAAFATYLRLVSGFVVSLRCI